MKHFNTFSEIIEDLRSITPLKQDLSYEQPIGNVLVMIKRVMINIQKSAHFNFTEQQKKEYSDVLKSLGCTTYGEANSCFKPRNPQSIFATLELSDNIEFPLTALSQLLDASGSSFDYRLTKMTDTDEYSWVARWLQTQGIEYNEIDEYVMKSKLYMKAGQKYIYPQMKEKWEYAVSLRLSDLFKGLDLEAALEIMEELDSGRPISEVVTIFNRQDHTGHTSAIVKSLVIEFSKRGPEFGRYLTPNITPEKDEYFKSKEQRNKRFEKELTSNQTKQKDDGMEM